MHRILEACMGNVSSSIYIHQTTEADEIEQLEILHVLCFAELQ